MTSSRSVAANYYASLHSHSLCEAFLCICSSRTLINFLTITVISRMSNKDETCKRRRLTHMSSVSQWSIVTAYYQTNARSLIQSVQVRLLLSRARHGSSCSGSLSCQSLRSTCGFAGYVDGQCLLPTSELRSNYEYEQNESINLL